jgi:acetylglutamate kinase
LKLLVKLGGTLLDTDASRKRLARELAQTMRDGIELVLVHGGGKQMTRFLAERGVESRFVNGLRVSTPEVIDAVLKVLAGTVNQQLVASLVEAGADAVGLSGIDASLTEAEQMTPELGAVGRPVRTNPKLLDVLCGSGFLPVVACVAGDRSGNIYNVNADQMAVACAIGFRADRLLFLTDVDGVKNADGQVITTMSPAECRALIDGGVASGGMEAKLNAAVGALQGGIGQVLIAPGAMPGIVARALGGDPVGTRLVA